MKLWELLVHIEFVSFLYCYYINTMLDHSLTPLHSPHLPPPKFFVLIPTRIYLFKVTMETLEQCVSTLYLNPPPSSKILFARLPVGIYLFEVKKENRKMCAICSKLTIKTLEQRWWCRSGVSIVDFDQENAGWVCNTAWNVKASFQSYRDE